MGEGARCFHALCGYATTYSKCSVSSKHIKTAKGGNGLGRQIQMQMIKRSSFSLSVQCGPYLTTQKRTSSLQGLLMVAVLTDQLDVQTVTFYLLSQKSCFMSALAMHSQVSFRDLVARQVSFLHPVSMKPWLSKCGSWTVALASPGDLLEMKTLGSTPAL